MGWKWILKGHFTLKLQFHLLTPLSIKALSALLKKNNAQCLPCTVDSNTNHLEKHTSVLFMSSAAVKFVSKQQHLTMFLLPKHPLHYEL